MHRAAARAPRVIGADTTGKRKAVLALLALTATSPALHAVPVVSSATALER